MQNNMAKAIKATIISLIVAFLFMAIVALAIYLVAGTQISTAISLINKMSVEATESTKKELVLSEEKNRLESYPEYGTQYAELFIDSIDLDLPVYFGDTTEILKLGVGHYSGSYFPGEGGSIIYAAHNTNNYFTRLTEVTVGDKITIEAEYGTFNYVVYDTQIIKETEEDKLPIQSETEILMLYTCYPLAGIGHKSQRFVVYAELVEGD